MKFTVLDIAHDPRGRELLIRFGLRAPNVVVRGDKFIIGKDLDKLADFLDVPRASHQPLPPEVLYQRWIKILRAAQRYIRQLPSDELNSNATPTRNRPIRIVAFHIFRIGTAFVECAQDGNRDMQERAGMKPPDGKFTTGEEIAHYGDEVIARIEEWWEGLADKSCQEPIEVDFWGIPLRYSSLNKFLDRNVWHSTHHIRQIANLLETRWGIEPNGRLTEEDLAGLPLPKRIWE